MQHDSLRIALFLTAAAITPLAFLPDQAGTVPMFLAAALFGMACAGPRREHPAVTPPARPRRARWATAAMLGFAGVLMVQCAVIAAITFATGSSASATMVAMTATPLVRNAAIESAVVENQWAQPAAGFMYAAHAAVGLAAAAEGAHPSPAAIAVLVRRLNRGAVGNWAVRYLRVVGWPWVTQHPVILLPRWVEAHAAMQRPRRDCSHLSSARMVRQR